MQPRRAGTITQVGVAIVLLATSCAAQPDAATENTSQASGTASASPNSPGSSPTQAVRPADVEAASLGWARVGSFPAFHPSGILGFEAGYVVFGTIYETGGVGAFYSRDASSWSQVALADRCGEGAYGGGTESVGATDGRSAIVLGRECDGSWATWTTANGMEWHRASIGDTETFDGNVWPTPSGWESLRTGSVNTVMRSEDGREWTAVANLEGKFAGCCPQAAATRDGLRVVGDHLGTLVSSTDGATWRDVDFPYDAPTAGGADNSRSDWLSAILPADRGAGTPWVVFTRRHDGQQASAWSSDDLRAWNQGTISKTDIANVASTRLGLFITGADACMQPSERCPPERRTQFHSTDGVAWTALGSSVHAMGMADGPAGIIAIGLSVEDSPSLTAWRLGPLTDASPANAAYTESELDLLFRVRADLQVGCEPLRFGLPPGAEAAIECHPDTSLVDSVGAYQFASDVAAARLYLERLAENGIAPMSGDCSAGRGGDAAWTPGDDAYTEAEEGTIEFGGHVLVTARYGCFLNHLGFANVRVVCGSVYIGLLGNDRDLASLTGAAWMPPPGTPFTTPMAPGICAGP